ncbi:MAG TPA: GNAT family N-acetyltransferase [Candidatus Dormibacteraeota bacterium]|jgi:ribosomal protein S18 acetylase RimI-like enzyme|nr:GNAT family N-acetyltransferase [Candidatus Dormibacteraeota bacterium]
MTRLRPGTPGDLPGLWALLVEEVQRGERDCVPPTHALEGLGKAIDWPTRSRVVEDRDGPLAMVLVLERTTREGAVARVETAARDEAERERLLRWGIGFGLATGAATAEVWRSKAAPDPSPELGLIAVRPFWRMDRADLAGLPKRPLPPGYRLARRADPRLEAAVFNGAFQRHWRFRPVQAGAGRDRPSALSLLALGPDGAPAAIVWCSLEWYEADGRAQPVGLIEAVGTLPEHRRRGVASALLVEALWRLRGRGARTASLYVDALNPTGAATLYHRLGFRIGFEYEVFEATSTSLVTGLRRHGG